MAQQPNPTTVQVLKSTGEKEKDPGLIIVYDVEAVHIALGHTTEPVPQGVDIVQSLHNFQQYVYQQVIAMPCAVAAHCIEKTRNNPQGREYYQNLFHCLPANVYKDIVERLKTVFIFNNTLTATWSVNVAAPAHTANSLPPNRPLGALIKVGGGVGLGLK